MEINWFTVIAQIVNFLILVWLLKRFLYKPVLSAIDEREEKIRARLDEAESKKTEAVKEHRLFREKNEAFDNERSAKMNEVHEAANNEKKRLFDQVREESTALRTKYESSLQQQQRELIDTVKRRTKEEVFAIAGKTLSDLADAGLEDQIVQVFIGKLRNLDNGDRANLKNAIDENPSVIINSTFDLPASSKSNLENVLAEITGQQIDFSYRTEPNLISGIEIDTENYQLSWNIEAYLDALKKSSIIKQKEDADA
ncbi:hypothetical protein RQM65_14450 [Pricia sp. S334]|uniref:ATP synthase subunit b n=1 Tax=Pricia mediterranea TaxID=3076079 RepID=A0ABU3L7Z5_9FLAO|nr:hypothetical protein [Pricia sp. S334]MDT7829871.1 hypothetical protein [Pricia sp. S334]